MLPSRVASAIRVHRVFLPGERVVVAVSGGPDSLALLAVLRALIPNFSLHLTVAHFDHGWRAGSVHDASFVASLAANWGFRFLTARADEDIPHTEDAARTARYAFLRQAAAASSSTAIALGHTLGDQAETVLLHLLRGSGSRGIAAMRFRTGDLARPMLHIDRPEIETYLADQSLTPRRDPSNDDPRYARNRLRAIVLPAIDTFEPAARRLLGQTADILGEEDRFLDAETDRVDAEVRSGRTSIDALPVALQRRLLHRLSPDANFLTVEAARLSDPSRAAPNPAGKQAELITTTCACDPAGFKARDQVGHLDADRVLLPLTIGRRKPGDRMRPLGMREAKRLQDILVDARIPRQLRDALPVVSDREEIVWIPQVSVAERKRVTSATRRQLHLEIT